MAERVNIRRWLVFAVAIVGVIFSLLLAHMFEGSHPISTPFTATTQATDAHAAGALVDSASLAASHADDGVPDTDLLALTCVLGLVVAMVAALLALPLVSRALLAWTARVQRRVRPVAARLSASAPSLESLAVSRM